MIASITSGKSFRGLIGYLFHGRDGKRENRAMWCETRNLPPTTEPMLIRRIFRATANLNLRTQKPVYHIALTFAPTDTVEKPQAIRIIDAFLEKIGLGEHQALLVAHGDSKCLHTHIVVNRIHPITGMAWDKEHDRKRARDALNEIETEFALTKTPEAKARYWRYTPEEVIAHASF